LTIRTLYLPLMVAAAVLSVACAVTLLVVVSEKKAQAAFSGKNGRIAFVGRVLDERGATR
jgi:hypothetical protein